MRYIEVKDLKIGDEIIISNYSNLRYCKVQSITKAGNAKVSYRTLNDMNSPMLYSSWYTMSEEDGRILMDTSNHNAVMTLKPDAKHIFLVKREQYEQ